MDIINLGILLMFGAGMRVGELAALKWDVFDGTGIKVRRTKVRYVDENGKYMYAIKKYTKTDAGIRYVVLPKEYLWIMSKLKNRNPFTEFLFSRNGERTRTYTFRKRLYLVCEKSRCYKKSPIKSGNFSKIKGFGVELMNQYPNAPDSDMYN